PPAAATTDVDPVERAGDRVEAGGVDDHVERVLGLRRLDPGPGNALDRRLAEIDQAHVRLVVHLVVAALERYAARAEPVIGGDQLGRDAGVLHPRADLSSHEVGY